MYHEFAASAWLEVMPASTMAPAKISFVFTGNTVFAVEDLNEIGKKKENCLSSS